MVITIASPDKLSIAMFLSFLVRNLGKSHVLGEIHSLMLEDAITSYVEDFLKINPKAIFTYYAKKIPSPKIPERLLWASDAVVWFNMYDTSYQLVKDAINFDGLFKDTWEKTLKQLG